jgi:uncharacterized protein (DUF2384 family)
MSLTNSNLFNSIAAQDYCHLFTKSGSPDAQKVIDLLKYKKQDLAAATDIPIKSIRYDEKMPAELKERLTEWATALNLVAGFFGKDINKTALWFSTPNPLLGDMSPRDVIRVGRYKKLLKFIQTALNENMR